MATNNRTFRNVGTADRVVRVLIGLALLSLFFLLPPGWNQLGWLAVVPFATALVGWCPLYRLFGVSTCAVPRRDAPSASR